MTLLVEQNSEGQAAALFTSLQANIRHLTLHAG
jgi:hypothetical protein